VVITVVSNLSKAIHERDFFQEKAWGLSFTEISHTHGEDFPEGKSLEDFLQIHLQVNTLLLC
jgi:hypothetical protein